MRRVKTEDLRPGMLVARAIVRSDGKVLLSKNTLLTSQYILSLHKLGIGSLYIKDTVTDIDIPEIISGKVRQEVSSTLKNTMGTYKTRGAINSAALHRAVGMLVEDVIDNHEVLISLEDIRTYEDYLFYHSINVAVLTVMTGYCLGYFEKNLVELGTGALLHDIGMTMIDPEIINKQGELTPRELQLVQAHPEVGFNVLKAHGGVSMTIAHMAYQHHERYNGKGYPRRIKGNAILEYARILAIADVFDALVSDRPYRKGYSLPEVLVILQRLEGDYFDPEILKAFLTNIAVYPTGSLVLLNTGQVAMVTVTNRRHPHKPHVKVMFDKEGNKLTQFVDTNLIRLSSLSVVRQLTPEESMGYLAKLREDIGSPEKKETI